MIQIEMLYNILSCSKCVVELDKAIYLFIISPFDIVMTSFNRGFIKEICQKHEHISRFAKLSISHFLYGK